MNKLSYISLILFVACGFKPGQRPGTGYAKIDSLLKAEYEAEQFSGSVVIGNNDSLFYQKHLGLAHRGWKTPIDSNTRFDIASINKSFVGALVLLAVEEAKISLDDRLVDLLQSFRYTGNFNEKVTIHNMLSHTSGLPDYGNVSTPLAAHDFEKFKRLHFTNQEYVDFISQIDPIGPPGKRFYYSNFAYHLLCIILEDVYGLPFSDLLQQKLCTKLNMRHTYASTENREVIPQLAEGYNYNEEKQKWERNNYIDLTLGRRIFSTTSDLYQWGKAMNNTSLFSEDALTQMKINHLKTVTDQMSYGYGWVVFDENTQAQMGNLDIALPYIIHGGSTEGYKSMLVNIDNGKYIIALLANSGARTNEMELTKKITHFLMKTQNEK